MVNRAQTLGLDGSGKKVMSHEFGVISHKTELHNDSRVSTYQLLSPPVENFNCFASLLKQTFTKPNATNGNHKRTIRTFYPHR
jgi:hypothetical protein